MKKKLMTLLCSFLMAIGFSASAFAAEVGYVDWNAVVANYPGIKNVAVEIANEKEALIDNKLASKKELEFEFKKVKVNYEVDYEC